MSFVSVTYIAETMVEQARQNLMRALQLLDDVRSGEMSRIERDSILHKIREAYDCVRFTQTGESQLSEMPTRGESAGGGAEAAVPVINPSTVFDSALQTEAGAESEDGAEVEAVAETGAGSAAEESAAEETAAGISAEKDIPEESACVEPQEQERAGQVREEQGQSEEDEPLVSVMPDGEQLLFVAAEELLQRPVRRNRLMSLYDDAVDKENAPVAQPETPAPKKGAAAKKDAAAGKGSGAGRSASAAKDHGKPAAKVLGEVIAAEVHTLGDTIARPKDIVSAAPVRSLRAAMGMNDRFQIIRDLFDGDALRYEKAIDALDAMKSLDDCLVHIAENYSWKSNTDGATLIMGMLQRRFK